MATDVSHLLPLGIADWPPAIQIATLILLTFTSEDATTIGAGLLAGIGVLNWKIAFIGCFAGIWVGDAGLYGLARLLGRPLLERRWLHRFLSPRTVARSEEWFRHKGWWLLFTSRLIPGLRLPTYLAAGLVRLPFGRFLAYTGIACFFWTLGIFLIAHWVGPAILAWLPGLRDRFLGLIAAIFLLLIFLRFGLKAIGNNFWASCLASLGRWRHWEFWPAWLFYPPVASCCLGLALRHRSLTLPTVSNPGIETGGLIGESKLALLKDLQSRHPQWTADAYMLTGRNQETLLASLRAICQEHNIPPPFVLKPDVGQRGSGMRVIASEDDAKAYLGLCHFPVLVQRYAPGPGEAGIFYYRFPGESKGHILAITEKIFPFITGDGQHTVSQLIWRDRRARYQAATYLARFEAIRDQVLPAGTVQGLVRAGNHAQGCIFRDGMHLWSPQLEERIDQISQALHEFYIGRFDVRFADPKDLQAGRNFLIVELNGASSEVTSIYDSRNSLLQAYRILFHQWSLVFAIGAANRQRGYKPMGFWPLWKKWGQYCSAATEHPLAD